MPIRAVTLDVYSALFDTVSGLTAAAAGVLRGREPGDPRASAGDARALARQWRQRHAESLLILNALDREPARNRDAIEIAARFVLRELRPPLTASELGHLVAAWERLPPWPEAPDVLRALRARPLILASLSNGDEDMQRRLLATLPVHVDHVISTEGGRFKPHPSVYANALAALGVGAGEVLHVAGSPTDAMGATASGITTLWVNRTGEPVLDPRYAPAFESRDLHRVVPVLDSLS
ncbi:MAG TPA: HAD-IA family hydrolase [bacterium]|nr:HAD-IA family hydrolase [bacterium]